MYGKEEIGVHNIQFESQFEDSGISCKHCRKPSDPGYSPTELSRLLFVTIKDVAHEEDLMQVIESRRSA